MAYDEKTAVRMRAAFEELENYEVKKMFGGLCFLVKGHMCAGLVNDELMVRVGPDQYDKALSLKHVRPMDFTGRPMKGMIYVSPEGFSTKKNLTKWLEMGLTFVRSLPPKTK